MLQCIRNTKTRVLFYCGSIIPNLSLSNIGSMKLTACSKNTMKAPNPVTIASVFGFLPTDMTSIGQLIYSYFNKFPGLAHSAIAKKIVADHPTLFPNLEACRTMVRYYAGKAGKKNAKQVQLDPEMKKKTTQDKEVINRWNLPKSKAKGKQVYQIPSQYDRVLWISDIHIPNHDIQALTTALEFGIENKANCIVIGGDLLDNAPFTRFKVPPAAKFAREIFDQTIEFLQALRRNFKNAHIIYMQGNHDRWYEDWLMTHCPQVFDDPYYQVEARLQLEKFNIKFVRENIIVKAGKLPMLHGHTVVRGVFAPVNSARGAYLKTGHSIIIGHTHQVSEHSAKDLLGRKIKVWSTGCLCTLQPDYDPHNIRHSHGFAFIETEANGTYTVSNMEIIDGKIR
mgnify:CR=1 FL=1